MTQDNETLQRWFHLYDFRPLQLDSRFRALFDVSACRRDPRDHGFVSYQLAYGDSKI